MTWIAWILLALLVIAAFWILHLYMAVDSWQADCGAAERARVSMEADLNRVGSTAQKAIIELRADFERRVQIERARIDHELAALTEVRMAAAQRAMPSPRFLCTVSVDAMLLGCLPGPVSLDRRALIAERLASLVEQRCLKELPQ